MEYLQMLYEHNEFLKLQEKKKENKVNKNKIKKVRFY